MNQYINLQGGSAPDPYSNYIIPNTIPNIPNINIRNIHNIRNTPQQQVISTPAPQGLSIPAQGFSTPAQGFSTPVQVLTTPAPQGFSTPVTGLTTPVQVLTTPVTGFSTPPRLELPPPVTGFTTPERLELIPSPPSPALDFSTPPRLSQQQQQILNTPPRSQHQRQIISTPPNLSFPLFPSIVSDDIQDHDPSERLISSSGYQTPPRSNIQTRLEPETPPRPNIVCEQTYYSYLEFLMQKIYTERSNSIIDKLEFFDLTPNSDDTKLIQQIDNLSIENSNFNTDNFINGKFKVIYGSAIDAGGPYNEYLRKLGENLQSIFIIEDDRSTNLRKLKFNPELNLFNLELFYAPLPTLLNISKLLFTKNVNIVSKLEFGHIIKVLIIDELIIDSSNIDPNKHTVNLSRVPEYFLLMIIKYIQYCSKKKHDLTEDIIKGFLQNANCFKATVYFFVKFIETEFEQNTKIDLDFIECFNIQSDFAFVEAVDWDFYLSESAVIRLIKLFSKNLFNVFQIYSMLYYNKKVRTEEFVSKLDFIGLTLPPSSQIPYDEFPEKLQANLTTICTNYADCLDKSKPETKELIDLVGSQESFIKLILKYMSGFDVIVPNTRYTFKLTSNQQELLFVHTCSKTIDILDTAIDYTLHDLTAAIISRIIVNIRFNRAG